MSFDTKKLNKLWYLVVTPYNTKGHGNLLQIFNVNFKVPCEFNIKFTAINQNVRIEVSLEGMNYQYDNFTLLVRNTTIVDDIICLEVIAL